MSAPSFDYHLSHPDLPPEHRNFKITLSAKDLTEDQLKAFPAFQKWITTLAASLALQHSEKDHKFHNHPYAIESIEAQSTVWFTSDRLGFVNIRLTIKNDQGQIPGAVFLRGGSVGMLMILQPDDVPADPPTEKEKWVLLTVQPRVAAGSLAFTEIPAGMIDQGSFKGSAAKEISEETHINVTNDELLNMSELAAPQDTIFGWMARGEAKSGAGREPLSIAMYPSPGGCDEMMQLFLYQKRLPRDIIDTLKDRETGSNAENEKITLKLVQLEKLWRECSRDGKALSALALYEGLRREGKIPRIEELSAEQLASMRSKLTGERKNA